MESLIKNDQLGIIYLNFFFIKYHEPCLKAERNEDSSQNIQNETQPTRELNGKFTPFLMFCVIIAVIGSSFQFGLMMAVFNTPEIIKVKISTTSIFISLLRIFLKIILKKVIKDFFKQVYSEKNNHIEMSNSTLTLLWSVTNGLLPFGGVIGGMNSGFVADYFGR